MIIPFSIHFSRFIFNYKKFLKIPLEYQFLGLVGVASVFSRGMLFPLEAIARFVIMKNVFNNYGEVEYLIDLPITAVLALYLLLPNSHFNLGLLEENYIRSDLIYHLLEFIIAKP